MFETIAGLPQGTVGLSATGTITGEDYEQTLIPLLTRTIAEHGKVRLLLHYGPAFAGYSPSAMWQDTKFGLTHFSDFSKMAVVSDVPWLTHAVRLFAPFMHCPVKIFANSDMDSAKTWIAS